jgi:hypothetical protein
MINIQNTVKWETNSLAGATSFQIGFITCLMRHHNKNYTANHLFIRTKIVFHSLKPLCGGMVSSI